MDREKLTKLLNLTASDNDAEALSAIRKANHELKGSSWEELLLPPVQNSNKEEQKNPGAFSFNQALKKKHRRKNRVL